MSASQNGKGSTRRPRSPHISEDQLASDWKQIFGIRHVIPPIDIVADPMGKHWTQPDRELIKVNSETAEMTQCVLEQLCDYSHSMPTGVYPGKMWKRKQGEQWWLCWFGVSKDPKLCTNNCRKVEIIL